jgi:SSS family solute:Na+ symporter
VAAGVIDALSIFYTLMGVSLFVPMLAGLAGRRATTRDAMAAIVAGVAIVGGLRLLQGGRPVAGFTPAMLGLAGAVVAFLASRMVRQ